MKLFHALLLLAFPAQSQVLQADSFFTVPDVYQSQYGTYRSPLKFYDGTPVKTAADWQRRRLSWCPAGRKIHPCGGWR
ncbi:hypothetical protein [Chitinophaga barathri]|uniref:hypothetical protein n=1 Tax=Chitinophaga barathri TaxID=1647451 RepID=UPI000F4F3270|nr:hypothetical protein [Chitinophaga barathri]